MGLRGNYTPLDPRVIWGVGGGPEQKKTKVGQLRYLPVANLAKTRGVCCSVEVPTLYYPVDRAVYNTSKRFAISWSSKSQLIIRDD